MKKGFARTENIEANATKMRDDMKRDILDMLKMEEPKEKLAAVQKIFNNIDDVFDACAKATFIVAGNDQMYDVLMKSVC